MTKVLMGLITVFLVVFVNLSTYALDNTVIDNCYSDLKTDIINTASGGTLVISKNGICEINNTLVINKPIILKVSTGFNFTLKLTKKVDSFIELNSNNITIDGFIINANNNAFEGIKILGGSINITHNKIFNILYDNNNIANIAGGIKYIPNSNITASGTIININLNEFYNIKNKIYTGIDSIANSIYVDFEKSGIQYMNIKGNIFNNIIASNNNQISLTNGGINFDSNLKVSIEDNSFVSIEESSILSDLNSSNLIISNNTYNVEDSTPIVDDKDNNINIWTKDKAEFLAKKVLYGATEEKVQELFDAGSREAAVNILFPSIEGPDRTAYNTKMSELLDEELLTSTSKIKMREYYTFKKLEDPYEAKSKLFGLFEDTFSVDTIRDRINYGDIEATHDMLYSHSLGNYKEMIKRNLYNNGNPGDYSLGEYLDLFNQTRPKYPNENYAREIMQLFLMLEYKPTESEDLGSTRNYTEKDVNAMAKIIFGFEADDNTHTITYNNNANTNIEIEFLDGDLKSGDSFPFYNSGSGTIDIQALKTPIAGNNGLPDNIIDYIFSKRDNEIAIFLADKFYRFYISENPTRSDLDLITNKILENNFDIYPTVKWLLTSDMMYRNKSMTSIIYKNPLELIVGTAKILGLDSSSLDLRYSLQDLNWIPYAGGKIFGRDGYDDNSIFYTPYVSNKWTSEASKFSTKLIENNLNFIDSTITDPFELITFLENKIYLGKELDSDTKTKLVSYLTHDKDGNEIMMDLTDNSYVIRNLQGLIYMMLSLPEYVLQSGYNIETSLDDTNKGFFNNDNKIVFIKASGGLDYLHAVIPKNEYDEYLDLRGKGAITGTGLIDLNNEYYLNSALKPFKDLYDSGNMRFINRVGTPNPSRGHDSASRKITSVHNRYGEDNGIFGELIKNEDPSKTIVLDGGAKPSIFRGGKYMGIGGSAIFKINYGLTYIDSNERNYKINSLKDILEKRKYIGSFGKVFSNGAIIDSVARESKANGGREGSGYNMEQRFTFLESLYDAGLGNASWLRADGGYDTHRNQKDYLSGNFDKFSTRISDFFNRIKDRHNVTIVLYSEFGRTNKLNSSLGTDHGKAGGMFIISNNDNLLNNQLPNKIYGNNLIKDSRENYLGVGIDYRSVYTSLFKGVYSRDITPELGANYNINTYIDRKPPELELLRIKHTTYNNNVVNTYIQFDVDDINFFSSQGSDLKLEYWSDTDPIKELRTGYYREGEKGFNLRLYTYKNKKYYYKITVLDNQYNKSYFDGNFIVPEINFNDTGIKKNTSTFLKKYARTSFSGSLNLPNSSTGVILSSSGLVEYSQEDDLKMLVSSGTYLRQLVGGSGAIWDGDFILPKSVNKSTFIGTISKYNNQYLSNFNISKIIKVGAGELGVGMKLNKNVLIEINGVDSSKNYKVIYSEDGVNWNLMNNPNIVKDGGKLTFSTDHFTYFALVEVDISGEIIDNSIGDNFIDGDNNNQGENTENIGYITSSGGSAPRAIKDSCQYGDFSMSYYDKNCGIDPDAMMIHDSKFSTGSMIEVALDELSYYDEVKYLMYLEIFENKRTFNSELDSKTIMIKKLREGFSNKKIGDFDLVHIKKSRYNKGFEKIANFILNKKFNNINSKNNLFNELNNLVILFGLYKEISIEKDIRLKIKDLIITKLSHFSELYNKYKQVIIKRKKLKYTYIEKNNNTSKKVITKKEVKQIEKNKYNSNSYTSDYKNNDYTYKVSVKSVILKADAYWKNNIGTLYKGDIVEQITNIHPKGFFKIRVIKSKEGLDGKEGYIFAKYLEE